MKKPAPSPTIDSQGTPDQSRIAPPHAPPPMPSGKPPPPAVQSNNTKNAFPAGKPPPPPNSSISSKINPPNSQPPINPFDKYLNSEIYKGNNVSNNQPNQISDTNNFKAEKNVQDYKVMPPKVEEFSDAEPFDDDTDISLFNCPQDDSVMSNGGMEFYENNYRQFSY